MVVMATMAMEMRAMVMAEKPTTALSAMVMPMEAMATAVINDGNGNDGDANDGDSNGNGNHGDGNNGEGNHGNVNDGNQ